MESADRFAPVQGFRGGGVFPHDVVAAKCRNRIGVVPIHGPMQTLHETAHQLHVDFARHTHPFSADLAERWCDAV
jgi:hypothetical protein